MLFVSHTLVLFSLPKCTRQQYVTAKYSLLFTEARIEFRGGIYGSGMEKSKNIQ